MIDTNILVDFISGRDEDKPFVDTIFHDVELGLYKGYISSLSICDALYALRKFFNPTMIKESIEKLDATFEIVSLTREDMLKASEINYKEYEDAIMSIQAKRNDVTYFITRNQKDFINYDLNVLHPKEFVDHYLNNLDA